MKDKTLKIYYEVEMAFKPTKRDPVGCDGVFVHSIRQIHFADPVKISRDKIFYKDKKSVTL